MDPIPPTPRTRPVRSPIRLLYVTSGIEMVHETLDGGIIRALREFAEAGKVELRVYPLTVRRRLAGMLLREGSRRFGATATAADERELANEGLLSLALSFRPDLCLFLHGGYSHPVTLQILREAGIPTAVWIVDDPYEIDGAMEYAHEFDRILTVDRGALLRYRQAGLSAAYLPLGTCPQIWQPRPARCEWDLFFAGSAFPSRVRFLEQIRSPLEGQRFLLAGQWWERLVPGPPFTVLKGLFFPSDVAALAAASRLAVNLERDAQDPAHFEGNGSGIPALSPNNRTFDLAALGVAQLVQWREDLFRWFEPDEVVAFRSPEEWVDLARYYLQPSQEAERRRIGERARRRALAEHTFRHRIAWILEHLCGEGGTADVP